jgi:serine/threonine protein kinase
MRGRVQRFGPDSVHNFLGDLEKRASAGWIPYLALEKMERQDNLLLLTDTGHTRGRFLPLLESLVIAQQICDILEVAHTRSIVYRDHKILHYYWQSRYNGVFMIDWNVAKRYPGGLSAAEIQFDLVQFGARSLHYIFTGRPAPGALPMGPNRPEEIEAANSSYTAQWTYDDQRLPQDIKDLLEAILSGAYDSARRLREDLNTIYKKLSELI